jgi:tetratricopeptide (TPR) repeat protein
MKTRLIIALLLLGLTTSNILPFAANLASAAASPDNKSAARTTAAKPQQDKLYEYLVRLASAVKLSHTKQYAALVPISEKLVSDYLAEKLNEPAVVSKLRCPSGLDEVTPLVRVPKTYGNAYTRLYLEMLELRGSARSHSTNKLAEAKKDHEQVIAECPSFIEARVGLATYYRLTRQFDKALAEIDKTLMMNPKHYIAWTTKAMIYQDMNDTVRQQEALKESYKVSTAEEREINSYMKEPSEQGKDVDPRNALRLIDFRPRNANAIATYAESINPPRPEDALKYATIAVNLDPESALCFQTRADINLDLGRFRECVSDADAAIRLQPDTLDTRITRALAFLNINKLDQSLRDLDFVISRQPDFTDAYNYRSTVHIALGETQKALMDAKKAVTLDPEYSIPYNNLGVCYLRLNMLEAAKQAFQTAVRLERKFHGYAAPFARLYLGNCYRKLNKFDLADAEFDKALIADSNLPMVMLDRCASAAQAGCCQIEIKAALSSGVTPKIPLVDVERINEGIMLLSRLIVLNPRLSRSLFNRATAYMCLNRTQDAAEDLQRYIEDDSANRDRAIPLLYLARERSKQTQSGAAELRKNVAAIKNRALAALSRFLLGEISEAQVLSEAADLTDSTIVRGYLAYHYITKGDRAKAKQHLQWVLLQGDKKSIAFLLSLNELQRLCARS